MVDSNGVNIITGEEEFNFDAPDLTAKELKFRQEQDIAEVVSTGYSPHALQLEVHMRLKRFSVLVCHRRWGKTVLAVNALIDAAARDTRKNARYAYIAPFRNQAKDITWLYFKEFASKIPGVKFNESELTVTFCHNDTPTTIKLYGADNAEAMRGLYNMGVVVDEVADMAPKVWSEIIRPTLTDYLGWCLFIGTPKGINLFSQLYTRGLTDPEWFSAIYPAEKSIGVLPWITEKELADARKDMTDAQYRQEFGCDFDAASDNILISIDLFRRSNAAEPDGSVVNHMPKVMGCDIARFGGDKSGSVIRQGLRMHRPHMIDGKGNMRVADDFAFRMDDHDPASTFIDGGRGEGVIDRLRQLDYNVVEINGQGSATNVLKYANKRAEMYDRLRKWMEDGGHIPYCPRLEAQITSVRYDFNNKGQLILEKKTDIKARIGMSPDDADICAITFAKKVRPSRNRGRSSSRRAGAEKRQTEYSVFGRRKRR